jgi:predicted permease
MVTPPPLLRRLVERLAPADLRPSILCDLDDLFRRRAASHGLWRARLWYARQALAACWHLASIRLRRRSAHPARREHRMGAADSLGQDLRVAARVMLKSPGATLAAVATLAVCIGANTAVFSLVQAVLLRPLPYANPDRLVAVWNAAEPGEVTWISQQELHSYGTEAHSLERLGGYVRTNASFSGSDNPERVRAALVSVDLLPTLGVRPALGRTFADADAAPGAPPTIVLGHGLWVRQFGGRPEIVGQTIRVNGAPQTVIGIMPEGFRLPLDFLDARPTEAWSPLEVNPADLGGWGDRSIIAIGRLDADASPKTATSEFGVISDRWIQAGFVRDQGNGRLKRRAVPLNDLVMGNARRALHLVFAAVGAVLLIACATVANLLLAKSEGRRQEMAVRAALGAQPSRLARQLLTESVLLGIASGAAGLAVAGLGVRVLRAIPAATIPRADEVGIDVGVLAFTTAVALGTGLLFGLVPALQLRRPDLNRVLNAPGRSGAGHTSARFRRTLVVAQLAFAVVLVVAAGLLVRSFVAMNRIELGFDPQRVLTAQTYLAPSDYPDDLRVIETVRAIDARLAQLPGVSAAGAVRVLPLARTIGDWSITIEGVPVDPAKNPNTDLQTVTPGYFAAMGIQPIRGRLLTAADDEDGQLVVVVNETMANRYWPGQEALGKRFHLGTRNQPWLTVVGIIPDVRHNAVIEEGRAETYVPHAQIARETGGGATRTMTFAIRTAREPDTMVAPLRAAVREVGPHLPLSEIQTMEQVTSRALAQPRLTAMLLATLAALALALAALGIYSTVSLLVSERTREIGIRVALGAGRSSILRLVAGEGALLAAAGLVIGTAGALLSTRLLQGLLYGVGPLDPVTFAAAPAVLGGLTVVACVTPARRAAGVDPVVALRA